MGWLSALAAAFFDRLLDRLARLFLDWRAADRAREDAGGRARAEAAVDTQDTIGEIADAQARAAANPGGDDARRLARELRERAAAAERGTDRDGG